MPTLYVVATPIGNLEDITIRALKILGDVNLIAAEDTRITKRILERYAITTPLTSYHAHSTTNKTAKLVRNLETKDIALVSDAGVPGINDPGSELIRQTVAAGFNVVPIPGPSAIMAAASISGFDISGFLYIGYLPKKNVHRKQLLQSISIQDKVIIALETPHRLKASLAEILRVLGNRRMAICRELTKIHEEVFRGTVSDAISYFTGPKGEITLVIEKNKNRVVDEPISEGEALALLADLRADGLTVRAAVDQVSHITNLPKRLVYSLWVKTKKGEV